MCDCQPIKPRWPRAGIDKRRSTPRRLPDNRLRQTSPQWMQTTQALFIGYHVAGLQQSTNNRVAATAQTASHVDSAGPLTTTYGRTFAHTAHLKDTRSLVHGKPGASELSSTKFSECKHCKGLITFVDLRLDPGRHHIFLFRGIDLCTLHRC